MFASEEIGDNIKCSRPAEKHMCGLYGYQLAIVPSMYDMLNGQMKHKHEGYKKYILFGLNWYFEQKLLPNCFVQ